MKNLILSAFAFALLAFASCSSEQAGLTVSGLDPAKFKTDSTELYVLKNKNGMEVCITNYGGRIVSVMVPDKNGNMLDVVHGFDSIQAYYPENNKTDFGATIGRYANRIDQGKIKVDGKDYQLTINNGIHHLHGGITGWQYKVFAGKQIDDQTLELTVKSPDGDNGYPGNVEAKVVYKLTDDNAIDIQDNATTDAPTIINMTNHAYFNLNGDSTNQEITNHVMSIDASKYTPVDSNFMTLGQIDDVAGTPFDFNTPTEIGARIEDNNEQLKNGHGYDHNWVLNKQDINNVAATVVSPLTGIKLEVYTDKPGLQVYVGNFLDGTVIGKKGIAYARRTAICLEPQVFPDSPNKKDLPGWEQCDPTVTKEKPYSHHIIYKFSVAK